MAKASTPRPVQCYHCNHPFEISAKAMTVSCPKCSKKLLVEDVTISNTHSVTRLQTCGRIVVKPRGRIIADLIEAHQGIEALGIVEAKTVRGGAIVIGPKAKWTGDCSTPSLTVKLGAVINSGFFEAAAGPQNVADGLNAEGSNAE